MRLQRKAIAVLTAISIVTGVTSPAFSAPYAGDQTVAAGAPAVPTAVSAVAPGTLDQFAVDRAAGVGAPLDVTAAAKPEPSAQAQKPGLLETALGKIDPLRALIAAGGLGFGLYNQAQARKQAADLQAQYDAAAALLRLEDWSKAAEVLEGATSSDEMQRVFASKSAG